MATFQKRGRRWRCEVMRARKRTSKTFDTKSEAIAWAAEVERQPLSGAPAGATVADLLKRYARDVSAHKRGKRWEQIRCAKLAADKLGAVRIAAIQPSDVAAWRDRRLREVSAGSVLREWNLLSAAFTVARREWGWLSFNPFSEVRRPAQPEPRRRRITDAEAAALYQACGYSTNRPPLTLQARVGAAFRLALATAMRAGEMIGLHWTDIEGRVCRVRGKTGYREIPLLPDALAVLDQLKPLTGKTGSVLGLESDQLDVLFRKARKRALLEDLHFHDTRAEALTRLSRKVDVLTLARISGHKDLRILQAVYYRETAAQIAERLS